MSTTGIEKKRLDYFLSFSSMEGLRVPTVHCFGEETTRARSFRGSIDIESILFQELWQRGVYVLVEGEVLV